MPLHNGNGYDESALIARAVEGDHDAFTIIMKRYKDRVFNTALRLLGNYAIAEELTQDVFITVFRKLHTFKGEAKFSTWLYRITVNHSKNRIGYLARRAHYRRDELMEYTQGDESISLIPRTERPDDYTGDREMMAHLMDRLTALKKKDREIIILKDFEELSYEEIASVLNIQLGTVKSRLSRARRQLKEAMKEILETDSD